ncbi:uncharacterized protein LOC105832314 [Monomorium pharaonis]|uniref:uncharacterized protein LOC105832314 n=1 Tax=Monomorium pharaonis TaxID=307658 RepID=UPI00063F48CE|nr:uncharacterized protein LOC105832314 [Monomorium pharaonis]XP_036141177.1 uncharacterized protein LOC105832314 [Monomorium pharaonis]XP_036141178.1 uncharacterized protein LOC105832314 [Monomorium pharaonis]
MSHITSRISAQLNRFLCIQNTLEGALEGDTELVTRHLINTRLKILENNWAKFQSEHDTLCLEDPEFVNEQPYIKTRTFERCQESYVQARATLLARQEEMESFNAASKSSSLSFTSYASNSQRGLPRLETLEFSGSYNTWRSFHDLFLSTVGNNDTLNNVEKMLYLKTCLTGDAAKLVINIPMSEDSFSIAWQKLVSRYENKRILISLQLDKLANLKQIQTKSARDLNALISTVSETLEALKALGCPIETWDVILVHQLGRLLDADTREVWEVKLGSTTSYPTLRQFEEFLIGQSRVWETVESYTAGKSNEKNQFLRSSGKPDNKSCSLVATTSQTPGNSSCRACKSDHYLHICPKFQTMNAQRRRRFITEQRLCFNCFGNHVVAHCSNTRRCLKCGQKHHSMIHDSLKSGQAANDIDRLQETKN